MTTGTYHALYRTNQTSSIPKLRSFDRLGDYIISPNVYFEETIEDGYVCLSNAQANIHAYGETFEDAVADLADNLDFAWHEYVLCDPSDFDDSALRYRAWFRNNIGGPSE